MIKRKQLEAFVRERNNSGYNSNMQFHSDAEDCGFKVADLGDVRKFKIDGFTGYLWEPVTDTGPARLVEFGALYLEGFNLQRKRDNQLENWAKDTARMFELLEKAEFVEIEK